MRHARYTDIRMVRQRLRWRQAYRPSGAIKVVDWLFAQTVRAPRWLAKPLFYVTLFVVELTPLGPLARMDLLAEQFSSPRDRTS
jgi:hypothetical protein